MKGEETPLPPELDPSLLVDLARMEMPFGRYAGRRLIDLPEPYVVWFRQKGFPRGRLGRLLALLYEVKANGLEDLIRPLQEADPPASDGKDPRPKTRRPPEP